jgi:hypothetical protein
MAEGIAPARWQDDLYDLLRRDRITQFAYVPDAGQRILIDRSLADPEAHSIALTSEERGRPAARWRRPRRRSWRSADAEQRHGQLCEHAKSACSWLLVMASCR